MERREIVDGYNRQIREIYKSPMTTLSDPQSVWDQPQRTWNLWSDSYFEELDVYFPKELSNIIWHYFSWDRFHGVALYSVPLKCLFNNENRINRNMIFFGRTDQEKFTMKVGSCLYRASGHFPLWMGAIQYSLFDIVDQDRDTMFLIGLTTWAIPQQFQIYEKLEGLDIVWKKDVARIVVDHYADTKRNEWTYCYRIRGGMLGRNMRFDNESDTEQ